MRLLAMLLAGSLACLVGCQKATDTALATPALYPRAIHFLIGPQGRYNANLTHTLDYNSKNKLVRIVETDATSFSRNRVTKIVKFIYDAADRLTSIRTYGQPYFNRDYMDYDTLAPYVITRFTYSGNRVSMFRSDTAHFSGKTDSQYTLGSLDKFKCDVDFGPSNTIQGLIINQFNGGEAKETYSLTTAGQLKSVQMVTPTQVIDVEVGASYAEAIPPFVNVPELRLYSLLQGESVYEYFYFDMIAQTTRCLNTVGFTYSKNTAKASTYVTYDYGLNPQNFPTEITSKATNSNGYFLGKRGDAHYTISYVTR
ncbi:hypothetical protein [Fibrella aquatica]|uniref:hypothetical protein n=1 Tax=Fibrella aquatica TaxID=3242487 RepID=UPI0035222AEE